MPSLTVLSGGMGGATFLQVFHFRRVVGRLVERDVVQPVVGDRDVEAIAEGPHVLVDQLLQATLGEELAIDEIEPDSLAVRSEIVEFAHCRSPSVHTVRPE